MAIDAHFLAISKQLLPNLRVNTLTLKSHNKFMHLWDNTHLNHFFLEIILAFTTFPFFRPKNGRYHSSHQISNYFTVSDSRTLTYRKYACFTRRGEQSTRQVWPGDRKLHLKITSMKIFGEILGGET